MFFALIFVIVIAAVIGAFVASFFVRRHGESVGPEPGWQATDEVFSDPSTNRLMRVWVDSAGDRHYVVERRGRRGA